MFSHLVAPQLLGEADCSLLASAVDPEIKVKDLPEIKVKNLEIALFS